MPAVTVITYILPVAIIIEIVDAWYVVTDVVIAAVIPRRIVVVRIVQISIVTTIAAIVPARITIAVIVVDHGAGLVRIDARKRGSGSTGTWQSQCLAFFDCAAAPVSHELRAAAQGCRRCVAVIVDADLIETRLLQIDCAARRRDFE